jgi:hypothetical protein
VVTGASPHPSSSFFTSGSLKPGLRPNAADLCQYGQLGSTTDGEIGGPRFGCDEVSNLLITCEYFEPDESATLFMIVAWSRSLSFLAVICTW